MKKLFLLSCLLLSIRFANATLYVIVVGLNPPDLTNLCLGDTIRFSGDSSGFVYGTVQGMVGNVDSLLDDEFAIISDSNYVSTWDHILIPGDVGYSFFPQLLGMGLFTINCFTGLSNESENLLPVRLYPNPAAEKIIVSGFHNLKKIIVFDLTGHSLMQIQSPERKVDMDISSLANGIYFVKVETPDQESFIRLVKY